MAVAQSSLRKSSFLKISFSDAISFNQETLEPMEALIGSALRLKNCQSRASYVNKYFLDRVVILQFDIWKHIGKIP